MDRVPRERGLRGPRGFGRRAQRPAAGPEHQPKTYTPPATPQARSTPPTGLAAGQGRPRLVSGLYNAQAVANKQQIVLAAEVTVSAPDFGLLEPMLAAAHGELDAVGVTEKPQTVLADAGYSHQPQMERILAAGIRVLIPPDSGKRKGNRPGWNGGLYAYMREVLNTDLGSSFYRRRQQLVEPIFANTKHNRGINRFHRRGRAAVRTEWRLITATHNLLKLHRHQLVTA